MARECEDCGCPLGDADIEASQCPACRKTIWRHVVAEAGKGKPRFQGTMVAPQGFEEEPSEGPVGAARGGMSDASVAPATAPSSLSDARPPVDDASPRSSGTVEPPQVDVSFGGDDATGPVRAERGDTTDGSTRKSPAADPPATTHSAAERDTEVDPPGRPAPAPAQSPFRGTSATIDPRYFDQDEWEDWSERLGGTVAAPAKPAGVSTAKAAGSTTDSRYVGKTSVASRALVSADQAPTPGADYTLGERLGSGGMGVVFRAVQRSINRDVALKMLKSEAARRRDRRDSLATEAIVIGELTHPNIVPIHDLGQDGDGNLFYSMKRVVGRRWDEALAEKTQAENLEVFLKVADAIAFAHSRGVVHRDLKPENVLLGGFGEVLVMDWGLAFATEAFAKLDSITPNTSNGGSPAYMAPEQAVGFLVSGGWRGGSPPPVTTSLDVYLLGAMLFEIVTGRPPHAGDDPTACIVAAAENRIVEVGSSSGLLPIALKAMATDPADRYTSVEELQRAVREYGSHAESVALAGRAGDLMRSGELARAVVGFEDALELWPENPDAAAQIVTARKRLSRRRYALAAMTAAFLVAITVGGFGINHQRIRAVEARDDLVVAVDKANEAKRLAESAARSERRARDAAQKSEADALASAEKERAAKVAAQEATEAAERSAAQEKAAREQATTAQREAVAAKDEAERERERQRFSNYQGRIKLIDARIEENAFAEADRLLDQLAAESTDLCGWEWGRLKYLCTQGRRLLDTGTQVTAAGASSAGELVVTGGADGRIRGWRRGHDGVVAAGPRSLFPEGDPGKVVALAASPDASLVAAAGDGSPDVLLYSTETGKTAAPERLATGFGAGRPPVALSFSADGTRLMAAGAGGVIVWDRVTREPVARRAVADGETQPLTAAAVSPDGRTVAAGFADGQIFVWAADASGGLFSETRVFDGHRRVAEFADGFRFRSGEVTSLAFGTDGSYVVSCGDDGRILRWRTSEAVRRSDGRDLAEAFAAAVVATRADGSAVARKAAAIETASVAGHDGPIPTVSVRSGASGDVVVTGGTDGLVKIWADASSWPAGPSTPEPLAVLRGHEGRVTAVAAVPSPAGLQVFSAGHDATARIWDVDAYGEVRELRPHVFADHEQEILAAGFDPAGRRLLTAGRDEVLVVTDLATSGAAPFRSPKVHSEAVSVPWVVPFPDGERLATGYLDGSFAVWDVAKRTTLARVAPDVGSSLTPPAVSPDGRWIAASWRRTPRSRSVAVWPVETLLESGGSAEPAHVFDSQGEVFALTFAGDGRVAFGDRPGPDRPAGGHVYIADLETGGMKTHRMFGDGVEGRVYALKALPDGRILAVGSSTAGAGARALRIDPTQGRSDGPALSLAGAFLTAAATSADGGRLITLTNLGDRGGQALEAWDLRSGERVWESPRSTDRLTALDLSRDGSRLVAVVEPATGEPSDVAASGAGEVRLLDAATGQEIRFGRDGNEALLPPRLTGMRISGIAFTPDGSRLLSASIRGVSEWDVERRERVGGAFDSHGSIAGAGFSSDGKLLISGHRDGSFDIRDAATPQYVPLFHDAGKASAPVTAAVFSPAAGSDRFAVAAGAKVTLRQFDRGRDEAPVVAELSTGGAAVNAVALSSDDRCVAAACTDGFARVWEPGHDGSPLALSRREDSGTAEGHTGAVTAVAFPRVDGLAGHRVVATGGADRNVLVWIFDMTSRRVVATVPLRGHRGAITDLAFLPGRIDALISSSDDGTAKLWDWDRGGVGRWDSESLRELGEPEEVLNLAGRHTAGLTALDVTPDGLTIMTAGRDGRAVLWPAVRPPEARR